MQRDDRITGLHLCAVTRVEHPGRHRTVRSVRVLAVKHLPTACLLDSNDAQGLSVKRVPLIENGNVSNPMGIT